MKTIMSFRMVLKVFVLSVFSIALACSETASSRENIDVPNPRCGISNTPAKAVVWTPGRFERIELGVSTYEDVKKLLGEPRWEGDNEETVFRGDREPEILLQYGQVTSLKVPVDIIIGEETRVVKALSYLPVPELSLEAALTTFGSDFFEISPTAPSCSLEPTARGRLSKELPRPFMLAYPEKGMYVSVDKADKIMRVDFAYRCRTDDDVDSTY